MTSDSHLDSQESIARKTSNSQRNEPPGKQVGHAPLLLASARPQDRRPPLLEECMPKVSAKKSAGVGLAGGMAAQAAARQANDAGKELSNPWGSVSEKGGGEAADRLDKRTYLDQGKYRVKLIDYGKSVAEIGWSFVPSLPPKHVGKGLSEAREDNEDRAIRRAKSRMRQLILSSCVDHLTTLTYRENVTDFDRADHDFKRFVRLVRRSIPGWVYVAVPERQKRGAWHWHLAVKGRQDVDLLRRLWRHIVGEGNIDVQAPRGKGGDRCLLLVRYLSKYLAKGFKEGDRELNGRRYRASLGIEVPMSYLTVPDECRGNVAGFALNRLVTVTGSVGFVWIADDKPAGWACSWK